ncbi:MAG: ribosome-binding factor A [Gemmataceae bacterium]
MKRRRPFRKDIVPLVEQVGPEDGIDPRLPSRRHDDRQPRRKALQLCGAVARTIQHALAWELHDEELADLLVGSVVPFPSSTRLLVTVAMPVAGRPEDVLARLHQHTGRLRALIARAVQRRRVPELIFRVHIA